MATIEDLPQMLVDDPQVREDFIATMLTFCQRHGIEATPENFAALTGEGAEPDTQGLIQPAEASRRVEAMSRTARMVLCGGPWVTGAAVIKPGGEFYR